MIDKEKVIKLIEEALIDACTLDDWGRGYANGLLEALEIVKRQEQNFPPEALSLCRSEYD